MINPSGKMIVGEGLAIQLLKSMNGMKQLNFNTSKLKKSSIGCLVIILGFIVFLYLAYVYFSISDYTDDPGQSPAFKQEFGLDPSEKLGKIYVKMVSVGDTASRWMKFNYDSNCLDKIFSLEGWTKNDSLFFPERNYDEIDFLTESLYGNNPNPPEWWLKAIPDKDAVFYFRDQSISKELSEWEYHLIVVIDYSKNTVYTCSCIWK